MWVGLMDTHFGVVLPGQRCFPPPWDMFPLATSLAPHSNPTRCCSPGCRGWSGGFGVTGVVGHTHQSYRLMGEWRLTAAPGEAKEGMVQYGRA